MPITNATLALQFSELLDYMDERDIEFSAWLNGTVGGGPGLDGRYTLTDRNGDTITVAAPAQMEDDVESLVTGAQGYKDDAETAATASAASAVASAASAASSLAYRDTANSHKTAAAASASAAASDAVNAHDYWLLIIALKADCDADAVLTAADVVLTHADVVSTAADVVSIANTLTYAEEWAINPEDDPVSVAAGGDNSTTFSALHWAAKAADEAAAAAASAASVVDSNLVHIAGTESITGEKTFGPADGNAVLNIKATAATAARNAQIRIVNPYTGYGGISIHARIENGNGVIYQTDTSGVSGDAWISMARDAGVSLFYDNTERFVTTSSGGKAIGTAFDLAPGADSNSAFRVYNNAGGGQFRIDATTGLVSMSQASSTGTYEEYWVTGARNGAVSLYYNGVAVLATHAAGIAITSAESYPGVQVANTTNVLTGYRILNSVGGARLDLTSLGHCALRQADTSGNSEGPYLQGNRDGSLDLYYNNVLQASTTDYSANGYTAGMQVKDAGGTLRDVGFNVMPYTGSALDSTTTLTRAQAGTMLLHTSGTHTWSTPASSDTTIPVGAMFMGASGGGTLSIAAGSSVTLSWLNGSGTVGSGTRTVAVSGIFTLFKITSSTWWIWGSGLS